MEGFTYAIPYLIVLFILIVLFVKSNINIVYERSNKIVFDSVFILLLVFIGFRGHVYSDWASYYPKFEELPTLWSGNILDALQIGDMEPGFLLYSIFVKSIFQNYFIWVIINTLIDLWVLNKIFKKYSNNYVLAFIVFFAFNGLMIEFNLYRNAKAIVLFVLSIEYLKDRKILPYFMLNLIGVTFHYSALLFFPLYFFLHKEFSRSFVLSAFIISNLIFLFQIKWLTFILGDIVSFLKIAMIADKTSVYLDAGNQAILSLGYFERIISFVIFTSFYKKLVSLNQYNVIFYNIFVVYFMFILCFYEISVFSERFSFMFIFSYWILYPNVFSLIKNKVAKNYFITIFILFLVLKTISANVNVLAKYDNLLLGIESYENRTVTFDDYINSIRGLN